VAAAVLGGVLGARRRGGKRLKNKKNSTPIGEGKLSDATMACPRRGLMGRRERVRKEECIEYGID